MFVINIDVGSRRCHSKRFGEWVKSYSRSLERLQMETNVNDTKNLLHTSFRRREMSATDGERRKEKKGGRGKSCRTLKRCSAPFPFFLERKEK